MFILVPNYVHVAGHEDWAPASQARTPGRIHPTSGVQLANRNQLKSNTKVQELRLITNRFGRKSRAIWFDLTPGTPRFPSVLTWSECSIHNFLELFHPRTQRGGPLGQPCYGRWQAKGPAPHAATTELVPKPGLLLSRPPSTSTGRIRGTRQGELQRGTSCVRETVAPLVMRRSRMWLMCRVCDGSYEDTALLQRHRAIYSPPSYMKSLHRPDGHCTKECRRLFCICEQSLHRPVSISRAWEMSTGEISMAQESLWHWGPPSSSAARARPIWGAVREMLSQQPFEAHDKRWVRCVAHGMLRKF